MATYYSRYAMSLFLLEKSNRLDPPPLTVEIRNL